jgi:hypothetical protein
MTLYILDNYIYLYIIKITVFWGMSLKCWYLSMKNPTAPSGIEPTTFQLVAQLPEITELDVM